MNRKAVYAGLFLVFIFAYPLAAEQNKLTVIKGQYLGQKPPGKIAEKFTEDIITYEVRNSPTFSPGGKEMIIGAMEDGHKYYKIINNGWTQQTAMPFKLLA